MKYAYVTLLMKGDKYLPGALVTANSLKMSGTKYDIICMITDDVSENARERLRMVYTDVVVIEYLRYSFVRSGKGGKYREQLNTWIDVSLTKFQCLSLTKYKKIFVLDVDLLVMNNIDCVFDHKAPASVFFHSKTKKMFGKDNYEKFRDMIPNEVLKKTLNSNYFGVSGSVLLLEPNKKVYNMFLNTMDDLTRVGPKSYSMHAGPDEYVILYFYVMTMGTNWFKLPKNYAMRENWISNHMIYVENKITAPTLLQFTGADKPWDIERGVYADVDIWWMFWDSYESGHVDQVGDCPYCSIIVNHISPIHYDVIDNDHLFINDGMVSCPRCTDLLMVC